MYVYERIFEPFGWEIDIRISSKAFKRLESEIADLIDKNKYDDAKKLIQGMPRSYTKTRLETFLAFIHDKD